MGDFISYTRLNLINIMVLALNRYSNNTAPLDLTATEPCTTSGDIQYGDPTRDMVRDLSSGCSNDIPKSASCEISPRKREREKVVLRSYRLSNDTKII